MLTQKEDMQSRRQFREWCNENRLRLKNGPDGFPIAASIGKYKGLDQFYEGLGEDWVGVFVSRETPNKFTYLHKRLLKAGCEPLVIGDNEGTYRIKSWNALPVAKHLKITKGAPRTTDPYWLREK